MNRLDKIRLTVATLFWLLLVLSACQSCFNICTKGRI